MTREDAAITLAARWPAAVCKFCGRDADQVDGDRVRWLYSSRTVCSLPGCIRKFWLAVDEAMKAARRAAPRRRSPAEVHRQILEEKRRKRASYRSRRKGKAA